MRATNYVSAKRQQGITLLVAIVLLLLASLMGLMAMNVGLFEQRSSGNDLRAKIVKQAAEAGLAQGFEYLMRADLSTPANPEYTLVDDASKWELCTDDKFPCGAVPASMRASMWRLKSGAGGYTDAKANGLASQLTNYMLKTDSNATIGSIDVAYGVAPVLCRVPKPVSTTSIFCASDMSDLSDRRVVTFVSVAQVRGDSGRTTLTQTVARSSLLAQPGGVPAVVATGSVTPNGGGDIVAMPDAAGEGLDLAVWTRLNVEPDAGAFGTCGRQDWLTSCGIQLTNADWMTDGSVTNKCSCVKTASAESWDILDKDNNVGLNRDVKPEEFPLDLFEFAFGVKAWEDKAPKNDGLAETRLPKITFDAADGNPYQLYPDEAFLYKNAGQIIGGTLPLRADQVAGGTLGPTSSGLIWCLTDCLQGYNQSVQIGSPDHPVALVVDGSVTLHATIFGLVFVRDNTNGPLQASTGGSAQFKFNSQSAVFGSVLIQGVIPTGSGGGLIYGDANILTKLASERGMARFDTLRGGWNDRNSY